MNTNGLNYKPAKVWRKRDFFYVFFYWRADSRSEFKRYKRTFDLNRIADLTTRITAATVMAETVTQCLKEGWNPETDAFPKQERKKFVSSLLPALIEDAHRSVLNKTNKERTISTYNSHKRLFIDYLKLAGRYAIDAKDFGRTDAWRYQEHLLSKSLSAKTINTKTDYASGIFKVMHRLGFIPENPFNFIENLPEKASTTHKIFTKDEIQKIREYLLNAHPGLWQFALFIYYCYMRPESIMHIKVADIDLNAKTLLVRGENHKNSKDAVKQLLGPQLKYLAPYIKNLDADDYIFSTKLKPGKKKQAPTRAAELWEKHVKKELGINKTAYGLKHTGAAHFIENNSGAENLKWLQMQLSHADLQTTSIYTNKLKIVTLDERNAKIEEF